ncbi:MAG TPA: hypothetical protein VGO47_03190 [Chlamydiales bacterium]|nr:hypothetical protein [Chlamydiales bacterium]
MSQQPYNNQQDPRSPHRSSGSSYPYPAPFPSHTGRDGYPIDEHYPPYQTHTYGPTNLAYPYYAPMPPPDPPPPSSANFAAYYGQVPTLNHGYWQPPALPLPSSVHPPVPPPVALPAFANPTPLVRHHNASSGPSTRNPNTTQEAVSHRSRPRYGDVREIPPLKPHIPNEHEGKKILYMPHMLFKREGVRPFLQASDAPLPSGRGWSEFPFSDERIPIDWIKRGYMTNTFLPTVCAGSLSKGYTKPRQSIETLALRNFHCKELLQCDELWTNARAYVQPSSRIHWQTASSSAPNTSHQCLTTWDLATLSLFDNMATAEGQGRAVTQLRSWFEQLHNSFERLVKDESDLEDVLFSANVTKPLNMLLQVRHWLK